MNTGLIILIFSLIFWIFLSYLIADIAKDKKIGFGTTFIISIFFTPLFGILCVIASPLDIISPIGDNKTIDPDFSKFTNESIEAYNQKDYDKSIALALKALSLNVNSANTQFNLSTLYSLKQDKINSYRLLSRATECGFTNYKKLTSHPDLEWLRSQPDFRDFMINGYRIK